MDQKLKYQPGTYQYEKHKTVFKIVAGASCTLFMSLWAIVGALESLRLNENRQDTLLLIALFAAILMAFTVHSVCTFSQLKQD